MDLQNLIDIEEIRQVTYRYDWAWDGPFDLELMLSVFTEDCIFDESSISLPVVVGHEKLAETYRTVHPLLRVGGGSMHYSGHHMIEFQDRDHATGRTYVIGDDHIPAGNVHADCVYFDEFVRTKDGWKIKKRKLEPLTPPRGMELMSVEWTEPAEDKD